MKLLKILVLAALPMFFASTAASAAAGCVIGGGKPLPIGAVAAFTAEQVAYIEAQAVPMLQARGYILYDSPNIPPTTPYLWHGSYLSIIGISLATGEIHGATEHLREGWETNFPCYVKTVLDEIAKRL
jgi:hypothetical protein